MIRKENVPIDQTKRPIRRGAINSTKVKKFDQLPLYPTSANVTMSTNGARYKFPNPFGAKMVQFIGVATRSQTAGFTFSVNTIANIPTNGAVYELESNTDITVVVTGNACGNTIFVLPNNPDYPTPPTGRYNRVSGSGNSFLQVNVVTAPTVDIRVSVQGVAHLRPGYYFEPQSSTEVSVANKQPKQKIVQCNSWFLIVDENAAGDTPEFRARSSELHIVNIDWPNSSTIVARATVVNYDTYYF